MKSVGMSGLFLAPLLLLCACHAEHSSGGMEASASIAAASPDAAVAGGSRGSIHDADIIFQTSLSAQSKAIQLATRSRFSHMGIVHFAGDERFVLEAVGPVKLTPLQQWITRGEGAHFTVMRLRDAVRVLTPEALRAVHAAGARLRGRPYDFAFGWSDERMYCSELVWKVFREALGVELGSLQRLGEFDLTSPGVQAKLRERYGDHVPVDEWAISPGAIAASPLLEMVIEE